MTTGHTLVKKVRPWTAVLVAALVLVGVLLAGCGDDTSTQEGTQTMNDSSSLINTIIVSGNGKVTTLPDEATIQVGVENDGATAAEALDANSKDMQKVLDRLKAEGIADKAIETANVVVYPNRYYDQAVRPGEDHGVPGAEHRHRHLHRPRPYRGRVRRYD